jgi:dipeptidyl aminopeptidase/acylaminoacyl peptidase
VAGLRQLLEIRVAYPADFSDDGETVLVLSNLKDTLQLYRVPRAGGELEQLTDFEDQVSGSFVPGSGRILLAKDSHGNERIQLYLVDAEPGAEPAPLVYDPEFIHRAPDVSRDGRLVGYSSNARNGVDFDVCVRPVEGGEERIVFSMGGWCEAAGFSPDGKWIGVARLTEKTGDNDLYLAPVDGGEPIYVSPHDDEAVFGAPAWLPDSSAFFFATSTGREFADIARYDMCTRSWEIVLESPWDKDCRVDEAGRSLLVDENADGYSVLTLYDPKTLERRGEVPLPGRGVVDAPVFSRDGRFLAYHFTSALEPGDAWVYDFDSDETTRLTTSPTAVPQDELVEPELHRFDSFDGESVPVFVYEPEGVERPPVIVMIHGGPEAQLRPIWSPLAQFFAQNGYAVAAPNVRGSTGYGKRYEHLDDIEKRLDSVRDLVGLKDWLEREGRFDTDRVVLYGGSYGGYMVLAGLAFHPEHWAAGVDIVGISSLVTFLENTSEWRRAFREREYGYLDRDREFLVQASPMTHVDRIRAPLFVIHGANDPRVPLGEAEQLHRVLTEKGIPCELLVYDDEGHGLAKLHNRLDAYPRAAAFLERVLSPARA